MKKNTKHLRRQPIRLWSLSNTSKLFNLVSPHPVALPLFYIISLNQSKCICELLGFTPGCTSCSKLRQTDVQRQINNLHLVVLYLLALKHPAALRHDFILGCLFGGHPGCRELTSTSPQCCRSICRAAVKQFVLQTKCRQTRINAVLSI